MKTRRLNKLAVAALAALALSAATVGYTSRPAAPSAQAGTNAAAAKTIAPAQVNLPPALAEVVRMSEAGMGDDVILSYLQKSANTYSIDADQIVYLRDVGVSSAVLKAAVDHSQTADGGQAAESVAADATAGAQNIPSAQAPAATAPLTPPAQMTGPADNFYDSLAPYGTWVDVPAYGWCWQPTAVAVNPAWQPYCNDGCWLWTDCGWYWNSYYSWGWAPFHYGRWCQYPRYGWLWCPDNVWGPAWVCWRDYPGYCGWAPLPPGACFTAGIGWTFNGLAVGFDFGFGLGPGCFTFCDFDDFCRRHPFDHFRHGHDADHFFHDSRVNNNFAMDSHHRFINRGIDPSRIEAATHTPIHQVAVRELPRGAGRATMPDRLTRAGNSPVIYRPGPNISVPRNPFLPGHDTQFANRRGNFTAPRGFTGGRAVENTPRSQPARPQGPPRAVPGASLNYPYRSTFSQPQWGGSARPQVTRPAPAPTYRPDYAYSRRSAPAWHSAPSWSAPRTFSQPRFFSSRPAPSFSRPAPSFGGTRSWGGGAHFGGGMHFGGGGGHFGGGMASGHGSHR